MRERIAWVPADDDINYTLLGMMIARAVRRRVQQARDLRWMWLQNLPLAYTWGPERGVPHQAGAPQGDRRRTRRWISRRRLTTLNPNAELLRRDDQGGCLRRYASPGGPTSPPSSPRRDASLTHRSNGIYGAMFAAAAIAAAFTTDDWRTIAETALAVVPQRSRFARHRPRDSIDQVVDATDWEDGYRRIHGRYGEYGHCRVFQETGTMINTTCGSRPAWATASASR